MQHAQPKIQLICVGEVMARTKISRTSIHRLQKQGKFPRGITIGRMVRWSESELDDYLKSKINQPERI